MEFGHAYVKSLGGWGPSAMGPTSEVKPTIDSPEHHHDSVLFREGAEDERESDFHRTSALSRMRASDEELA